MSQSAVQVRHSFTAPTPRPPHPYHTRASTPNRPIGPRRVPNRRVARPLRPSRPRRGRHSYPQVCHSLRRNRYIAPSYLEEVRAIKGKVRPRKKRARWTLETSIWAPRKEEGNSRDFFETPQSMRKLFEADWNVAVRAHELGWYIVKCHNDPSTWRDLDRNGTHDEVDEVREALWQHHRAIYGCFEYYSALYSDTETAPGEPDVYNMTLNAYMVWIDACKMVSKKLTHGEFETVFAIVNAVDKATIDEDRLNSKSTLNRQEFLQCLVRCAIVLYVKRGTIGDVSDAVGQFLANNMLRHLPPQAVQNSNAFRARSPSNPRASRPAPSSHAAGDRVRVAAPTTPSPALPGLAPNMPLRTQGSASAITRSPRRFWRGTSRRLTRSTASTPR